MALGSRTGQGGRARRTCYNATKNAEPRYEGGPSEINFIEVLRLMSVTYTATLPVRDQTVLFLSGLLRGERLRRGTRTDTRALSPFKHAVLVLRWFLDGTRVAQLACDNAIGPPPTTTCTRASPSWPPRRRHWNQRCSRRRQPVTAMSASTAR